MAEASDKLQSRFIEYYRKNQEHFEKWANKIVSDRPFVQCAFLFDGVMDWIRFNVKEHRFDQFIVNIATEGITTSDLLIWPDTAFCDKSEFVIIEIPVIPSSN